MQLPIKLMVLPCALLSLLLMCGCKPNKTNVDAVKKLQSQTVAKLQPILVGEKIEVLMTDSGKPNFRLKTNLVKQYPKPYLYTTFPKGITLTRYSKSGKIEAYIKAAYAIYYEKNQVWEASNGVLAINAAGDTLKTESLTWNMRSKNFYSNRFVRITQVQQNRIITGLGFTANQDFANWSIKKPQGIFYIDIKNKTRNS